MAGLDFLQSPALTKFVYPFLLIFFVVFALLQKTKILGDKQQINALVSFVIGFIFVSAVFPKEMVGNLILFLTVGIIIVFVILLLWGFVAGEEGLKFSGFHPGVKWAIGIVLIIAVIVAVFWAAGLDTFGFFDKIFHSSWSESLWTNVLFLAAVAVALTIILKTK